VLSLANKLLPEGYNLLCYNKINELTNGESSDQFTDALGNPLFEMKGTSKVHWKFVRLVAKAGSDMMKIKSHDAIKAFCMICCKDIRYSKGNGNSVYRHVETHHKRKLDDLLEQEKGEQKERKKMKTEALPDFFSSMNKEQNMKKASKDDQLHGEALIVKWISEDLRPFKIVEDSGFVDLCDFLCRIRGQFVVPSRVKTRNQMMKLAEFVMNDVKHGLTEKMDWYSLTTDIWSSRVMQSFLALTLHYLTEDFEMKLCVLEVKPLIGSHTAQFIRTTLMSSMHSFGLQQEKLAMLLRDNASNGVKACNEMQIKHFGCIGHGLHLVVGPFLLPRKQKTEISPESGVDEPCSSDVDEDELSDVAEYQDLDEDEGDTDAIIVSTCEIVSKFRTMAKYVKNSPKAKEKLLQFGGSSSNRDTITVLLDVRTRWNSALDMLMSMMKLKAAFVTFLYHLGTSDGKKEFNRKVLPSISEEEWIFIEGLCLILTPFKNVTSYLSGDKYPTFTRALPLLRQLKTFLTSADEDLFSKTSSCKPIAEYVKRYEDLCHFQVTLQKLKACCVTLLSTFRQRFVGLSIEVLWVTFLDPRSRKMKHLTKNEYDIAKTKLIDEIINLTEISDSEEIVVNDTCSDKVDDPFFGCSMFDSPTQLSSTQDTDDHEKELLRAAVLREVENYLDPQLYVRPTDSPLVWWREHRFQFPRIAVVARKWLSVPASSTPSERVFSHCGVALTAKRASMRGEALMNQILLKNNIKHVNLSFADVKKALLKTES
jgi:hypothetical protein